MPYPTENRQQSNVQPGTGHLRYGRLPTFISERSLDTIPGCLVLIALLLCILGAAFLPRLMIYTAGAMALYSAIRLLLAGIANLSGLKHIEAARQTDWYAQWCDAYNRNPDAVLPWDVIRHVVIIPNFNETFRILADTLENLAQSPDAQKQLIIVIAMEAAETGSTQKANRLHAKFAHRFADFFFTVHPAGLPGERQCKSANAAWAGRWVKRELVEKGGYLADHIVVTTMDADTLWHRAYFAALTYHFATDPARYHRFWQAPIRYHGGIYRVHPMLRPINAYATAIELAYLNAPWWLSMPISSYSLSLRLLDASEYWDTDVIADEWHMYIKAFYAQHGELSIKPIYLPFTATAVSGPTLWQTVKNRYRQTLRHAWGSKEVGYTIANTLNHVDTPRYLSLRLLLSVTHDVFITGAGWIIITAGSQLPLLFHPPLRTAFFERGIIYPQTLMLEVAFIILVVLAAVFLWIDIRTRPPRTTPATLRGRSLTLLGFALLPLFTVLVVVLPMLHAQIQLLCGQQLKFYVTEKS